MTLEHFKTQVLLLHSQQSTLDVLSAGFGERYAVHVATSGTEALNTLGETPIHVIVSAQDLPGMSGLEALREAKKRSPDTIGILLAGSDRDDGLEALVGDKEVFQIVRGAISPEALRNLIDTATKQVRLLAISESANDQAANVDEPAGEHIVMETSENGASIISDGTGTLPVLRSHKVHISPHAGGRNVDVLVLTQDQEFLATIKDSARGLHNVHYANTPAQAETLVGDHKVGVLVTDAAMVGSNIEAITQRLRAKVPRLVAVVAGRRDDGELLMDLINRGHVYRFLLKPVSPGRARLAIEASVKHHMEGSDAAFKRKAQGAAPPEAAVKPAVKPAAKPLDKPRAAPPMPAAPRARPPAKAPEHKPPTPAADKAGKTEPTFRDSGRFTATMTGLAATIGKSLGGSADAGSDGSGTSLPAYLNPKILAAVAATVIVVGGAAWWLSNSTTTPRTPTRTAPVADTVDTAEPAPSVVETDIPQTEQAVDEATVDATATGAASTATPPPVYQALLDEARIARDSGEIITPPESNAIQLYMAARTMAPAEPVIAQELEQVINQALVLAETALLEQRTKDAATALRMVRMANPDNPRLPFLDAQVTELQFRAQLDGTRAAIREGRFEDAGTALAAAEALAGDDKSQILLLAEELATARSAQRVGDVLALANQRMGENALIEPANDNARYYYELALSTDPNNTAALQGLTIVASTLVLRARDAIAAGQLDEAASLLEDVRELDPASSELAASAEALEAAQIEAERQAELENEAAKAALAGAGGSGAGSAALVPGAGSAGGTEGMGAALTANSPAAGNGTEPFATGSASEPQQEPGEFVPISSLKRTNYVVPEYPRTAQRRNITGWVDVSFTVTERGNVVDVGIMNSNPGDVFNEAATDAISQWRFEPSVENGVAVTKRVAVRLSFDLQ